LQIYLDTLNQIFLQLDKTKIVDLAREYLPGYTSANRDIYKLFFKPSITPDFMYTKLVTSPPIDGKQLDIYKINPTTDVTVFELKDDLKKLYQINPPEFQLTEDKYELIELARKVLSEHQPRNEEFLDPHKMRRTFTNIGKGMIQELAEQKGMFLSPEEIENLTEILVRHTIGFGVIELLLEDPNVQDLTINSPMGQVPIFLLHNDHNECITNITPTKNDFESWATKLRLLSGRPLDEANPILDTEVILPKARSRLSIIGKPLNPYGFGMSFRRHRDKPWTLPLFIENKMISPLGAGLLSFTIHGARTHLVAGTRSSGKSSFLGSMLLEIMRKYRVLTVEDSVTGDCEMLIKKNGLIKKRRIGDLVNEQIENYQAWYNLSDHEICGNPLNIKVLSMDKKGKIEFSKVSKFIRHKVKKDIFEVRTSTGRIIKVTGDHSLFTLGSDADIVEIKTGELKLGDYIASPREYTNNNLGINKLFITQFPSHMDKLYFRGKNIKEFLKKHKSEVKQLANEHGYKKTQRNKWFRLGLIPGKILSDLHSLNINISHLKEIEWKCGHNSFWMPIEIKLDKDFLTLLGLWLADGCYDKNSIIFSVSTNEERNVIKRFAKKYKLGPKIHCSDGISTMLHSKTLKFLFREILELKGNAFTKIVPNWIYSLSKTQIACVLCGLFSGDGCVSDKEIVICLNSKKLIEDIQTLLLQFGIIFRIRKIRKNSNYYPGAISTIRDFKLFKEHINLLQEYKKDNLIKLCSKTSTHDSSDIIPLSLEFKKKLKSLNNNFNSRDYINSNSNIGRTKFGSVAQLFSSNLIILSKLKSLSESNIFWDKVVEVKKLKNKEQYVFDLSVPGNESFICNNIVAHNTLELPTESMRKLGYNIQPLKVRSALVKGGAEVPADEGIRTSLRLGDSALIVGEVRSSIRGNEEVLIVQNGQSKLIPIQDLEGVDISNIFIPTMDFDLKFRLKKLLGFVKHPKRTKLLEVTTKTGRKITVTPDHSLFTHKDFKICPIECQNLEIGTKIIIPEKLPSGYNNIKSLNLLELLENQGCKLTGYEEDLREIIKKIGWKKATEIANVSNDIYQYLRNGIQHTNIPISTFNSLCQEANHQITLQKFKIKNGTSNTLEAEISITEELCRFLGYYVAEGYTQKTGAVVFSNSNSKIKKDIVSLAKNLFNMNVYQRLTKGLGFSTQMTISNRILGHFLAALGCGRIAPEKRVPHFIFGLSENMICEFLKGYFDGDGSQVVSKNSGNSISANTVSEKLANDIAYLLLHLGIVARIEKISPPELGNHVQYKVHIKHRKYIKHFLKKVGFTKYKKEIIDRRVSHSTFNTVNYDPTILEDNVKIKRKYRHLRRNDSCGKDYLKKVVEDSEKSSNLIKTFVNGDFYLDEVREVKEIFLDKEEFVYDLSVEPGQNFIGGFGGIMLHNTEALALYEAMRIGASANVVAGTIHGDSPYGIFDRVVNDLGVPKTSFKATDIIVMCSPIQSASGMSKMRRVTSITEVRKTWEDDPLQEGGFVDLMKYNAKTDMLEPTPDLINGDSEVLKAIGGGVKEWVGNWDAIWDNIKLRAEIKSLLVDYSKKINDKNILEAEFALKSNEKFYRISEEVKNDLGSQDTKVIKERWEEWLKEELKNK
ncbi:MAG: Flp pilus assembly complex ATPase component TadA, partial [Nanoarchaeota archaeon]|nr:Flp pilus assembly complex ATPase component TadA [Nanoarchaeota archaeon]